MSIYGHLMESNTDSVNESVLAESASLKSIIKEIVDKCKKILKGKGKEIVIDALEAMITTIITEFFSYYKNDCNEKFVKNKAIIADHLDIKAINCKPFVTEKGNFVQVNFSIDMDKEFLSNVSDDHIPSVNFFAKYDDTSKKIIKIRDEIYFDG